MGDPGARVAREAEEREGGEGVEGEVGGEYLGGSPCPLIFEHFARVWELAWALCVAIDNVSDGLVMDRRGFGVRRLPSSCLLHLSRLSLPFTLF